MSVQAWSEVAKKHGKLAIVAKVASKKCPIPNCEHKWVTPETLFGHLWEKHQKNELVAALIDALGL